MNVEADKSPFKKWNNEIRTKHFHYYHSNRQFAEEYAHSSSLPANQLFVACTYNFVEILDPLLKSSSDVLDCRNSHGMNSLEISAYHGHYQLTKELFSRACKVRSPQSWGPSLLARAASGCPNAKVIEFLVSELPEVPVSTATLLAAATNKRFGAEVLRLLISQSTPFEINESIVEALVAECATTEALQFVNSYFKENLTTEAMLKAVVKNRNWTTGMLRSLLADCDRKVITEDLVIAMLSNDCDKEILQLLFSYQPNCRMTSRIIQAAAGSTMEIFEYVLSRAEGIEIGEETLVEAIGNQADNKIITAMLIERYPDIEISEWSLRKACVYPNVWDAEILQLLLNQPQCVNSSLDLLDLIPRCTFGIIPLVLKLFPGTEITKNVLTLGIDTGLPEMKSLLAQPRAVPLSDEMICTAARHQYEGMIQLLLQHLEITQPSEDLILHTVSNRYHGLGVLNFLIEKYTTVPVTHDIIKQAIKICGVGALDIVEQLFTLAREQEVTDELLLAGAAGNLEVMAFLMQRTDVVEVSEALIIAAISATNKFGIEVLQMLLSQTHGSPITESILTYAAAVTDENTMAFLLSHTQKTPATSSMIIAAAQNMYGRGPRVMDLLIGSGLIEVPQEAYLAAVRNEGRENEAYHILKMLLSQSDNIIVNNELAVAAAANEQCPTELMELLLSHAPCLPLTESILVAAAQNMKSGDFIMRFLLCLNEPQGHEINVTEQILIAAAGNIRTGFKILELLLPCAEETAITEEVIITAVSLEPSYYLSNWWSGRPTLKLLLQQPNVQITEVIRSAAGNGTTGREFMRLILSHRKSTMPLSRRVIEAVVANKKQGDLILKLLIETRPEELHLDEEILSLAVRNDGCGRLILQRLLGHIAELDNREIVHRIISTIARETTGIRDALFQTAYRGQTAATQALLSAGADLTAVISGLGNVLEVAAYRGRDSVVRLLVEYCANINVTGGSYSLALLAAWKKSEIRILRYLAQKGADIESPDRVGRTLFHHSLESCDVPMVDCLLELGADIHAFDRFKRSAIHHATYYGFRHGVKKILEADISVLATRDLQGRTPLHWSVRQGDAQVIELLLQAGADKTVTDLHGRTPLQMAVFSRNEHLYQVLGEPTPEALDYLQDGGKVFTAWCDFCDVVSSSLHNMIAWRSNNSLCTGHISGRSI